MHRPPRIERSKIDSETLRGRKARLGFLFLELVVVFVGVLAAFFVEDYRDRSAERHRAEQIAGALYQDLQDFEITTNVFVVEYESQFSAFDSAVTAGSQPAVPFFFIPGSEKAPQGVWEASMSAGVIDLLDPVLVFDLSYFYSEIDGMGERTMRYGEFAERSVLPLLLSDTTRFYDIESGELKPEFAAYARLTNELLNFFRANAEWAALLGQRMREAVPSVVDFDASRSIIQR